MVDAAPSRSTQRPIDTVALARLRRRLAAAQAAPWLHGEVARRMAERLPVIVQQPATVLDWWSHNGGSAEVLQAAYPKARRIAVEAELQALSAAPPWWSLRRRALPAAAVASLPAAAGDLLWSNMMLHWCADPQAEMQRWFDVLAPDGFLMFSTLGPGTLDGLRAVYADHGWPSPHVPFVDMHDLGDMLVHAGFSDPVMDQETVTLTWPDPAGLLAELRQLGANVDPRRHAGLRTPRWRSSLQQALQDRSPTRPALAFEIVYGHAFRPLPRAMVAAQTRIGLDDMRARLHGSKKR
jgi:malonyl-CoA O-methyltransferase